MVTTTPMINTNGTIHLMPLLPATHGGNNILVTVHMLTILIVIMLHTVPLLC